MNQGTPTYSREISGILGNKLERLESASLRYHKFLRIGKTNKREELEAVAELSGKQNYIPVAPAGDGGFTLELGSRMIINMAGGILENAGLALHRFFNCPYIPGSALKGIARHAAWCEWNNAGETQKETIDDDIHRIFGSPASRDNPDNHRKGSIAFLNAFPADRNWKLRIDILNSHGGNDYTNPVPNFFMTVEKGAGFVFTLKQIGKDSSEDLEKALYWLKTGLMDHGAGAKTAGGYGWFRDGELREDAVDVELITPGFFGGASQYEETDTTLRVSSLRGMLRWWWRTLYRDKMNEGDLKKLEDSLWGSTNSAGLIRTRVVSEIPPSVDIFQYKVGYNRIDTDFARSHGIDRNNPGILYLAYGMDEGSGEKRRSRPYCEPGSRWKILFSVRNNAGRALLNGFRDTEISNEEILNQGRAALSLLCRFGGMGSRSRKGFGSLQWEKALSLEDCRKEADVLCRKISGSVSVKPVSYSWSRAITREIRIDCSDSWRVLDGIGLVLKEYLSECEPKSGKAALGLPRNNTYSRKNYPRFASPLWYHLDRGKDGIILRLTAFPSATVTDEQISEKILNGILHKMEEQLKNLKCSSAGYIGSAFYRGKKKQTVIERNSMGGLKAGDKVRAVLQEEKTKKGKWKVTPTGYSFVGTVINSDLIPVDSQPGDEIDVIVKIAKEDNSSYEYIPVE